MTAIDPEAAVRWWNEPAHWSADEGSLLVTADGGTDFWRLTGYGYARDNGHLYGEVINGDFDLSVRLNGAFSTQYDQAGAMLRLDESNWLKTGVEYYEGRLRFSTVVTIGQSSWAMADLPPDCSEVSLLLRRRDDAVEILYSATGGEPELCALAYLPPDRDITAGLMCAAPEGRGFRVAFYDFEISAR